MLSACKIFSIVTVMVVTKMDGQNSAFATWWLLGMQAVVQPEESQWVSDEQRTRSCHQLPFLAARQQQLCSVHQHVLQSVSDGVRWGIRECQHQFRNDLWNCSTFNHTDNVFGAATAVSGREAAFVHAVSSAGVTHSVTRACSRGLLADCGCRIRNNKYVRQNKKEKSSWKWGGCSEDVEFGMVFSRKFVDSVEQPATDRGLVNLHNNAVGRREVRRSMTRLCKCHGISGSCNLKVCWNKMAPFRQVGARLRAKFDTATHVRPERRRRHRRHRRLLTLKLAGRSGGRRSSESPRRASKHELVFLHTSPDFCRTNTSVGVTGTMGRRCRPDSWSQHSCHVLCCGRGWTQHVQEVSTKCHCRFIYCCRVQCSTCNHTRLEYRCN